MPDNTPSQSTYQTQMVPLVKQMSTRGSLPTQDEDFVNIFPEMIKNKNTQEESLKLVKRDGCTSFLSLPAGTVRGCYYWKEQNKLFFAIDKDVSVYNATTGAFVSGLVNVYPSTTTGVVSFTEFLYDSGDVKLVTTDGTTLSTIDSAITVVAGSDPDMPVHLPYVVFIDGYIFIVKTDTADIYNSNLNDPLLFTAGDFISAEMVADRVVYLTKLNNYIVVFGNSSIEYFWDAGIATGSPLQRNDTPVKLNGFVGGVAQLGNKLYFVGAENSSTPEVFMLDDFKMKPIGTEATRRHLASLTDVSSIKGSIVSMGGHDFYVLDTGVLTYVMDLDMEFWYRWTFKQQTRFPVQFSLHLNTGSSSLPTSKALFLLSGDVNVYRFSASLYQDNTVDFTCVAITDKIQFSSMRNKFMGRLTLWVNRPLSSTNLLVQWSDNDYQTYSAGQNIDISKYRPSINRLGQFRERAFKLSFTQNSPLLLQGIEVDINKGVS